MKKIKFIESTRYLLDGSLLKTKKLLYPSLTFPYLAALTPPEFEVSMTHELFDDIDFNERIDLAALTSVTNNIFRAYEIADEFKKRDIPVVMGGFHASAEPEEALEHVDAVFIHEAEKTWPLFLEDFKQGTIKKIYKADHQPSLAGIPIPDYSIIDRTNYTGYERKGLYRHLLEPMIPIQTARGCPNGCDFCDITHYHQKTYRTRPISDVVNEIQTLGAQWVCFVDDNIFADLPRAKELCRALIPHKIIWIGQGTIDAAEDSELLALAQKSGCRGLLVGIETIFQKGLDSVNKGVNRVEDYEKNLLAFKKAGINIDASLVFGFDEEGSSVFNDTYNFLMKNRVPFAGLQPLRPSPGTPFYHKLKALGRLKEDKWWLNRDSVADVFDLKYTHENMGDNFAEKFFSFYKRFNSIGSIIHRFLLPPQRNFFLNLIISLRLRKKLSRQAFISEY